MYSLGDKEGDEWVVNKSVSLQGLGGTVGPCEMIDKPIVCVPDRLLLGMQSARTCA